MQYVCTLVIVVDTERLVDVAGQMWEQGGAPYCHPVSQSLETLQVKTTWSVTEVLKKRILMFPEIWYFYLFRILICVY